MENEVYCTVISKQLRWVLGLLFFCLLVVLQSFQRPLHFVLLFFYNQFVFGVLQKSFSHDESSRFQDYQSTDI